MILTQKQLDEMKCENKEEHPNGTAAPPILLGGRCHPGAPTFVFYESGTGLLSLHCAVCRRGSVQVAVAQVAPLEIPLIVQSGQA